MAAYKIINEREKKNLLTHLQEVYIDTAFGESDEELLGFPDEKAYQRGHVYFDFATIQSTFDEVISAVLNGTYKDAKISSLSYQDRLDVLLTLIETLNVNPRRGVVVDLGALDTLIIIAEKIPSYGLSSQESETIHGKLSTSLQIVGTQISQFPLLSRGQTLDMAITKLGELLNTTPQGTSSAETAQRILLDFWQEFTSFSAARTRKLLSETGPWEGNDQDVEGKRIVYKEICDFASFMVAEYYAKSTYASDAAGEIILHAFDTWVDKLYNIHKHLPIDAELYVAMTHDDDLEITQHAWCRLLARNHVLVEEGRKIEAEAYISYMMEHVDKNPASDEFSQYKQRALQGLINQQLEMLYPTPKPKRPEKSMSMHARHMLATTSLSTVSPSVHKLPTNTPRQNSLGLH